MKKILLTSLTLTLTLVLVLTSCTHENVQGERVIRNAVTDVDGNHYDAVKIGNQVWMQSNLRTTHFRDGSEIPKSNEAEYENSWGLWNPHPCYMKPTLQQVPTYDEKMHGLYYDQLAVNDARGLCPRGWHVPTRAEWIELEEYVGSKSEYVYDGEPESIAKALASTVGWDDYYYYHIPGSPAFEPEKNNATGFTAVPAGDEQDSYAAFGHFARFWFCGPYDEPEDEEYDFDRHCFAIYGTSDDCYFGGDNVSTCSVRCVRN